MTTVPPGNKGPFSRKINHQIRKINHQMAFFIVGKIIEIIILGHLYFLTIPYLDVLMTLESFHFELLLVFGSSILLLLSPPPRESRIHCVGSSSVVSYIYARQP